MSCLPFADKRKEKKKTLKRRKEVSNSLLFSKHPVLSCDFCTVGDLNKSGKAERLDKETQHVDTEFESHHCISLRKRSWGIRTPPRQSRSSSGPHSWVAGPRWAWCSPRCSGSYGLQAHRLIHAACPQTVSGRGTEERAPLYWTMIQVSISGCTPSIRIMNLR